MRRFALTMTSKGQVTLPADYRRALKIEPGDRLSLLLDDEGRATLTKTAGDLMGLQAIARRRAEGADCEPEVSGARPDPGPDPIGDYLVAEDERTKSGR